MAGDLALDQLQQYQQSLSPYDAQAYQQQMMQTPGANYLGAQQLGMAAINALHNQVGQRNFELLCERSDNEERAARARSFKLLCDHLNDEQRWSVTVHGYFDVTVTSRRSLQHPSKKRHQFRIFECGRVEELLLNGPSRFCVMLRYPVSNSMPAADMALTLLLLIKSDLSLFFKTARRLT